MKKYTNKLLAFNVKKRKDPILGLVVDYSESWTLLRFNPVDFVIDGYMLINNAKIKAYRREVFIEKVIKLKNLKPPNQDVKVTDLQTMLPAIDGLLQIELKASDVVHIARLIEIAESEISVVTIKANGKEGRKMKILIDDIWSVQFDNDYTTSLELLSRSLNDR